MAGRVLGRYEVLTQLASGGMAAVYIARAIGVAGFERLVAVKVLHPHLAYEEEFISMFLDEARLAARIRHPNVVPTLDISDSGGDGYFLVMEYIEGDHLGALLGRSAKQGRRLETSLVMKMIIDGLGGLGAAHSLTDDKGEPLNIVHRDVSPHNIMVGTDGISRLTDFVHPWGMQYLPPPNPNNSPPVGHRWQLAAMLDMVTHDKFRGFHVHATHHLSALRTPAWFHVD